MSTDVFQPWTLTKGSDIAHCVVRVDMLDPREEDDDDDDEPVAPMDDDDDDVDEDFGEETESDSH